MVLHEIIKFKSQEFVSRYLAKEGSRHSEELLFFIHYVLLGFDPYIQEFFNKHQFNLMAELDQIKMDLNMPKLIHRGVIFAEEKKTLAPFKNYNLISFSEDLDIAKKYANPNSEISLPLTMQMQNPNGYLITLDRNKEEFHFDDIIHSVLILSKMNFFKYIDATWAKQIQEDREVLILQPQSELSLTPFASS
jgi:hypothetical protein